MATHTEIVAILSTRYRFSEVNVPYFGSMLVGLFTFAMVGCRCSRRQIKFGVFENNYIRRNFTSQVRDYHIAVAHRLAIYRVITTPQDMILHSNVSTEIY
jgi:hypothetical protein